MLNDIENCTGIENIDKSNNICHTIYKTVKLIIIITEIIVIGFVLLMVFIMSGDSPFLSFYDKIIINIIFGIIFIIFYYLNLLCCRNFIISNTHNKKYEV
jgi:hypothetical protein